MKIKRCIVCEDKQVYRKKSRLCSECLYKETGLKMKEDDEI